MSSVRYEVGFLFSEDGIFYSHRHYTVKILHIPRSFVVTAKEKLMRCILRRYVTKIVLNYSSGPPY
jgi:hypothetical protein